MLPSGAVEVGGRLPTFAEGSAGRIELLEAWDTYQSPVSRASRLTGVPVAWIMGVMLAESGGNPRACSPCSICRSELCASGAGMRCCAFGLMQFIAPVAFDYGTNPTEIVEDPYVAIEVGAELLADLIDRFGFDLPKIAAAYNAGSPRCSKSGTTFGWRTNGDYPMVVVRYANTALELGLSKNAGAAGAVFLALAGASVAWGIWTDRIRV